MNIFEDLIEELKEENLLEETVTETEKAKKNHFAKSGNIVKSETVAPEIQKTEVSTPESFTDTAVKEQAQAVETSKEDFYRKRAMEEVAFLQIVEHVFAGVEREQLKIIPKTYNDLEVKKVLHNFLHLAPGTNKNERSKAEFQLMQETESWHSSLTLRDERITTAHLRRYCETSRPPLSSPALVALARFYRNSPYSEPVRNKFDLVITRLFSREVGKNHRETIFSRDELAMHLAELYAEWSSVSLYSTEPEDGEILKIVKRFEAFMREADGVLGFDELIKSNFFTRLHSFKRSANENFYAPLVTAAGIESNIHIGNRYVELLELEKKRGSGATLEEKYGFAHDNAISEATGKTYSLIELLKQKKPEAPPIEEKIQREPETAKENVNPSQNEETKAAAVSSNSHKWVIAITALVVLVFLGLYFFGGSSSSETGETSETATKPKLVMENTLLSDYLEEAHLENGTLKGVVLPIWNQLIEDQQKDILKQMLRLGGQKGYEKVELVDKSNKLVGSAAAGNIQVLP